MEILDIIEASAGGKSFIVDHEKEGMFVNACHELFERIYSGAYPEA